MCARISILKANIMVGIVSSSIVEQANPLTTRCQDAYSGDWTKHLRFFMCFHNPMTMPKLSSNDWFLPRTVCVLSLLLAVIPHAIADSIQAVETPAMGNANRSLWSQLQGNNWTILPEMTESRHTLSPDDPAFSSENYRSPLEKLQQSDGSSWFMNILHGVVTEYDRTHHAPHPLTPPNRDNW